VSNQLPHGFRNDLFYCRASNAEPPTGSEDATVLTAGKVRCSPCSMRCAWLCSSRVDAGVKLVLPRIPCCLGL
jgi:hypothetical protein